MAFLSLSAPPTKGAIALTIDAHSGAGFFEHQWGASDGKPFDVAAFEALLGTWAVLPQLLNERREAHFGFTVRHKVGL